MLWLDGSLGVTVVTGVSAWLDQSGNVNANATQLTPANQPTYTASDAAYNNKGTLSFNGTTQFMTCAGLSACRNRTHGSWSGKAR